MTHTEQSQIRTPLSGGERERLTRHAITVLQTATNQAFAYCTETYPDDLPLYARIASVQMALRELKAVLAFEVVIAPKSTLCSVCKRKLEPDEPIMQDKSVTTVSCINCHLHQFGQLDEQQNDQLDKILSENNRRDTPENPVKHNGI